MDAKEIVYYWDMDLGGERRDEIGREGKQLREEEIYHCGHLRPIPLGTLSVQKSPSLALL